MRLIRILLIPAGLLTILAATAAGEEPSPAKQPLVTKLAIVPAAQPPAVFKYQLTRPFADQTSGNAARSYHRAVIFLLARGNEPNKTLDERRGQIVNLLAMPINDMPRDDAAQLLEPLHRALDEMRTGSLYDSCDWELPIRGNEKALEILIPEIQEMQLLGRALALRIRLEILEGKYDAALDSLRTGFAAARHIADMPFLVSGLIGNLVLNQMYDRIEEWGRFPSAPNLYWPLTALPRPLIDLERAMQVELAFPFQLFPLIRDAESAERTPEQWNELLGQTRSKIIQYDEKIPWDPRLDKRPLLLNDFPEVRTGLERMGFTPAAIERMPPVQAIALYTGRAYEELRDELFKWFHVPFWQGREGMVRALESVKKGSNQEVIPLAGVLLPDLDHINLRVHRAARRNAELRVIEALRMYAAGHKGNLPDALSEITEVPIPIDPLSGKEFQYRRDGDKAVIEVELPPGLSRELYGQRYELTVKMPGKP